MTAEKYHRGAKFKDLLDFLEEQTKAALDSVFGESQNPKEKMVLKPSKALFKTKSSSFATSLAVVTKQNNDKQQLEQVRFSRVDKKVVQT